MQVVVDRRPLQPLEIKVAFRQIVGVRCWLRGWRLRFRWPLGIAIGLRQQCGYGAADQSSGGKPDRARDEGPTIRLHIYLARKARGLRTEYKPEAKAKEVP